MNNKVEKKIKFLIIGATGMAGHTIATYLYERGHSVTGFSRKPLKLNGITSIIGDAMDKSFVEKQLSMCDYDAIVNCIGILNQSAEINKAHSVYLNAYFPHYLAFITKRSKTQIIHLSTDCVFSGKKGGYEESDIPDGTTFYDRSKALGEINDEKNLTLRNSIIGPDLNKNGIGLLNWFLQEKGSINGYSNVYWTGVTTLELAKIIEKAAIERASGLMNMVPDKTISKYHLLKLFNTCFCNETKTIIPFDHVKLDKSLIRTNYDLDYTVADYKNMLSELSVWMNNHRQLYPHYPL